MALGDHLYDYICENLKKYPGNYLEIGVFNGDGFARVASSYQDKKCYVIDPFIEDGHTSSTTSVERGHKLNSQKENFLHNTRDLTNIEHNETTSIDFFNLLTDQQIQEMNIGLILIDGSHHFADVVNDYKLSMKLLSMTKLGLIIFDDLHVTDVKQAYDQFLHEYKDCIETHGGIGGNSNFVKILKNE